MRILIHLTHSVPAFCVSAPQLARLRAALPRHELVVKSDEATFLDELPSADAAIVWRFLPEWYERGPRLRMVLTPAAGRELVRPDPRGRVPAFFGTFHGHIMAESLLAMIGFVNRRLAYALYAQGRHAWDREGYWGMRRLAGQTALLIGYGHVGRHCGKLLQAIGMRVHALKRDVSTGTEGADRVYGVPELLEAVDDADHVVCILPGDTGTDALLGASAFARMKRTAAVYNIGRGNAIDAPALRAALREGRIAAAFLDVLPEEPLPPESELWSTPNLYITPHVSAVAVDYLDLFLDEVVERLTTGHR